MAVWPVAAFFLGGLAAQITAWVNHRRQRAEKAADDAAAVEQRREDFELQHLVEVNQLLRAARAALGNFSYTLGQYHETLTPGPPDRAKGDAFIEACNAFEAADAALSSQVGFIIDDRVRDLAGRVREELVEAYDRHLDSDDPKSEPLAMRDLMNEAYEALSVRVRDIYAGRSSSLPDRPAS